MPLRSFSQSEMILTERKRMELPLLWTVWLGAAAFSLGEGQWFYMLAATLAVAINMLAVRKAKEVHVHAVLVGLGAACATGILLIEIIVTRLTLVRALGHYLILLQVCKLFQRKGNRDYTQILALSGLSIVATAMVTNELWFAGMAAVYMVLLCRTAMTFALKRGLDDVARVRLVTESSPPEVHQVAWNVTRAWPRRAIRHRVEQVLAVALATGVGVFLTAPRRSLIEPKLSAGASAAITGFLDRVSLGDNAARIYQSNAVMMQVRMKQPDGSTLAKGPEQYLRGATFNSYAKSKWSKPRGPRRRHQGDLPAVSWQEPAERTFVQEVSMDSSLLPNLFVSFLPLRVDSTLGSPVFRPDLTLIIPETDEPAPAHVRYTATCLAYPLSDAARVNLALWLDPRMPADPTEGIEVSPRVKELARQWCGELLSRKLNQPADGDRLDLQIAERVAERLKRECSYTLDLRGADAAMDGVDDFLFRMRRGHCEYFASAMTVMCRSLGVRARLVTGFLMDEYDRSSGCYIVRGRDAHAWTEVFTPSSGWVVVDATPPGARGVHGLVWVASVRRGWNNLQFLWYEKVVGYDASVQLELWRQVRDWLAAVGTACLAVARAAGNGVRDLFARGVVDQVALSIAIGVGSLGLVLEGLLVFRLIRQAVRARRIARGEPPAHVGQVRFMRRLLSLLAGRRLRLRPNQTLKAFAAEAVASGMPAGTMNELVGLYYRIRWGRQAPRIEQLRDAEGQVESLRQSLRRGG